MQKYIICLAAILLTTSCGTSPKKAREELNKIGVAYNNEAFRQAFVERDEIAIDLFIDAERDASFLLADMIKFYSQKEHENLGLLKKIIDNSSDVNKRAYNSNSLEEISFPLEAAVANSNVALIKLLLDKGADPNINHGSSLRIALVDNSDLKIADLLIKHGADINQKRDDMSLLSELITNSMFSFKEDKSNAINFLLDQDVEVNDSEDGLSQAVLAAMIVRNTELVETLFEKGAKIEFTEKNPSYPVVMSSEEKFERNLLNEIAKDAPRILTLLEKYSNYQLEEEYELVNY